MASANGALLRKLTISPELLQSVKTFPKYRGNRIFNATYDYLHSEH